jgi:hypothetical protein
MLKRTSLFDSPLREEHEIELNGKVFRVEINRSEDGPVFSFPGTQPELEPHERDTLIVEMGQMYEDFCSRRLFGSYKPLNSKQWTKKKASNFYARSR